MEHHICTNTEKNAAAPWEVNAAPTVTISTEEYARIVPFINERVNGPAPALTACRNTREDRDEKFRRDVAVGMLGEVALFKLLIPEHGTDLYVLQRMAMSQRPITTGDAGFDVLGIDVKASTRHEKLPLRYHHLIVPLTLACKPEHEHRPYALVILERAGSGFMGHCMGWLPGSEIPADEHPRFREAAAVPAHRLRPWR